MIKTIIFVLFVSFCLALDFPKNFMAGTGSTRGDQQQVNNFAVWNSTSNSWNVAIPHGANGDVNSIVAVGNGLLAVGTMTTFSGGNCNGLLYYDGKVWSAPEGVGLFSYTPSNTISRYENPTLSTGSAFAATVVGNDVYILGSFNQVGLVRFGVNGFVKLTWTTGNVFTIGTVGNGYNQAIGGDCTSFCPIAPFSSAKKFTSYTSSTSQLTFVVLSGNNLYTFVPDAAQWNQVNAGSGARNLLGNIQDFDIFNAVIYVVGKFDNTNDAVPANQYLHIARSSDNGNTWQALSSPQPLNVANFATLSPVVDPVTQLTTFVGLNAVGLTAIYVESDQSIYVAGGWRTTQRNVTLDNLAGQMQTRVFQIVGSTLTILSERFAARDSYSTGAPEFNGPNIYKLTKNNNVLYAYGDFHNYRQIVPFVGARFGTRYTEVIKGAAAYVNSTWIQAHGGFLTTTFGGDSNPTVTLVASNNLFYFVGTFQSSYQAVSGSVFGFGGDFTKLEKSRWNAILGNSRFVSAKSFTNGIGAEGEVKTLHLTQDGRALIIGGEFDWIGSQRIGGVAWYNPRSRTVDQVGGGLYQTNTLIDYGADSFYNNRIGGIVYDFEERGDYLYAGGVFNRNNSGNALYNIAQLRFKTRGAGWEQLDGGCDNRVRDLLVVGDLLYVTGSFMYCGLVTDQYTGDLVRGRVPTSRIAVIDLSESKKSWRNLGIGLDNDGYALASRGADIYVGGTFSNAGGKLYTNGIARWRGDHWDNVIAKCRGNCDRENHIFPYIGGSVVPAPTDRKPDSCVNLRRYHGNIYCLDTKNGGQLSYFDANTWYQAGTLTVATSVDSNTLIGRNASNMDYIMVVGSGVQQANGANLIQYSENNDNYIPSYTGFSTVVKSLSTASTMFSSSLIIFSIVVLFI